MSNSKTERTGAIATPSMSQAIVTRYYGPTHTKGSRIIARAEAGWTSFPYDHALNSADNHAAAARKLADRYGWHGDWIGGAVPNGNGYVWVDTSFRARDFERIHQLEDKGELDFAEQTELAELNKRNSP